MFANRIFGNYCYTGYAGGGSDGAVGCGVLSARPQLKLIAFAEVDYVHLNSSRSRASKGKSEGARYFRDIAKTLTGSKTRGFPLILHLCHVVTSVKLHFRPCYVFVYFSIVLLRFDRKTADINFTPASRPLKNNVYTST